MHLYVSVFIYTTGEIVNPSARLTQKSLGYILAMHYSDQLTGSSANLLNLQCFAGRHLENVKVVEPFLAKSTIFGASFSPSYIQNETQNTNRVRLSDIFDIDAWERYSQSKNYSTLVSWETFLGSHPRPLILVHHEWRTSGCDPQIMLNATQEFVVANEFVVVRQVCLDFRKSGVLSPEKFIRRIYGQHKPNKVVVLFNVWGGIIRSVTNFRLGVRTKLCSRYSEIRLSRHSDLISNDAKKYVAKYMNNSNRYVAIMIRFEYLGIRHNFIEESEEFQREQLLECYSNISSAVENLKRENNINNILLTTDFSRHGSKDMKKKKSPYLSLDMVNETVPEMFKLLFGKSFDQDEWEGSFESVAHFKVSGYIAVMQKTLAANSACLVLVGGGSFQASTQELFGELHPDSKCVIHLCS